MPTATGEAAGRQAENNKKVNRQIRANLIEFKKHFTQSGPNWIEQVEQDAINLFVIIVIFVSKSMSEFLSDEDRRNIQVAEKRGDA